MGGKDRRIWLIGLLLDWFCPGSVTGNWELGIRNQAVLIKFTAWLSGIMLL